MKKQNVAHLIVKCLEQEGVKYVFGIPGEENINLVHAIGESEIIRFILVRHEQGASFMADLYGRLTGKAGVCASTLGPGALNLLMGVADANTDSCPLVAISAQVGINRIYKETHQVVDLLPMFKATTKWADMVLTPASVPEMMRKAFDKAQKERPGATYIAVPQDVEVMDAEDLVPLTVHPKHESYADDKLIVEAAEKIKSSKHPVVLVGYGAVRNKAEKEVKEFCNLLNVPVATTFMGKGVYSDKEPNALGVVGFMAHDYENFAYDKADTIIAIGYELQEFAPSKINPKGDKKIIHIHNFAQDIDADYPVEVSVEGNIPNTLTKLTAELKKLNVKFNISAPKIQELLKEERELLANDNSFPVKPQRMVADTRKALGDEDIVLADTGAIKMWMARLYPTYKSNTCLIANGLSPMSFSLPGAIGAHFACPDRKILATMGDGSFMMNSQEIETAVRERVPLKVLIWEDHSYGLIKWKMDMEIHTHSNVDFTNPDFKMYAESFGAHGHRVESAEDLLPTLKKALAEDGVSVVVCPVDYSENMKLINKLGTLTMPS